MAPVQPEVFWVAHPDVVSGAIRGLITAFALVGGALISVIVYIWRCHKKDTKENIDSIKVEWRGAIAGIEKQIEKVSTSLETIADKLFVKTDVLDGRLSHLEGEHASVKELCGGCLPKGGKRWYDPPTRPTHDD